MTTRIPRWPERFAAVFAVLFFLMWWTEFRVGSWMNGTSVSAQTPAGGAGGTATAVQPVPPSATQPKPPSATTPAGGAPSATTPATVAPAAAPGTAAPTTPGAGAPAPAATDKAGWKQGVGYGWIWGDNDELGALNMMTPASTAAALQLAKEGKVYDLGVTYSRNSFRWGSHNPAEVISFRSPTGIKKQKDLPFTAPEVNASGQAWHSAAIFINDNVGTQIDGLGHATVGDDNHWYNGFTEAQYGGDFGLLKCDAAGIPPIVARAVLLDIATLKGVEALPRSYPITRSDIDAAMAAQKVEIRPGDVVLFRTGTMRYWGKDGADAEQISEHDSAGITLGAAKYLVQNFGVILIGSDTNALEVSPAPEGSDSFIPVHKYLLVEQGVYIGELHNLEQLAKDKVYEFCYIALTNRIAGASSGFALRPIALR